MTREEPFGPRGLERRRSPRIPIAQLEGAVAVVGAKLVSVSLYGMMIDSPLPLERDSMLSLRLVVQGHKSDVEARVAECSIGGASVARKRYGVGLEFTDIPGDTRERLEQTLSRVPERTRTA